MSVLWGAPGVIASVSIGYEINIDVLHRAVLATQKFSVDKIERIKIVIKTLAKENI